MIKGISLFANVGIDEHYLKEIGVEIVVSNELLRKRADFYQHLYPKSNMICGDITDKNIYEKLSKEYKDSGCDFVLATPPCQGMSIAGKMKENDVRNTLIINVIDFIKENQPSNALIENVPGILKFSIKINQKIKKIVDYIKEELEPFGYIVNYDVVCASDYNTPQYRKRAIFLISKIKKWDFPKKHKHITVEQAIGDLPSLESGEICKDKKYHYSKVHNKNHILWLRNTPTGKTALDNKVHYPNIDGRKIKAFSTSYKRIDWHRPAPTITMGNGGISSQNNVHPGKRNKDGTYTDARVLTILELLRLSGLPDDWDIPEWASDKLIREVLGESFPPKFCLSLMATIPRKI
jgi:DNA (cytosine-5)-methyltransferase 1